ncbi:uncharacterized protein LOC112162181 isoform X2 [Oryzias melastigma]|uniref:uncharacterized protein LOC112162181 isoform X2 n=1 Tax=Oryzias melastigma TaxID=30732 RepID=UPI000CF7CF80|nr:uncharacterized protein LOC112162181 isoform X2 [Oryzias melastigma]
MKNTFTVIKISLGAEKANLSAFSCSCVAGKGFCNHVVALLYQTAHYSQLRLPAVPPALACTSDLQRWHRPRTQGIHPEPAASLVVRKPKTVGKSGLRSTLYRAYTGPLPDPDIIASGEKLRQLQPQPLMALVLDGLSEIELTPSRFGPVPRGSPMSYHCPPEKSSGYIVHHMAPEFPPLPLMQHILSNMCFVPTLHQLMHLQSLQISPEMSAEIEKGTREQSRCPSWAQLRRPRLTASRFHDACCYKRGSEEQESAAVALAAKMIRGSTKQTTAMKRGLLMEPEVLANYAELMRVNVLPAGFIIHPEAPHLGASPDGRVYDPSESPSFGLVEIKSSTKNDVSQVAHLKVQDGHACLRHSHSYYWQVQGQLAVTGLEWCDFVTDTLTTLTVERVWRDELFIEQMKAKLDMFYYNTFINVYISSQ